MCWLILFWQRMDCTSTRCAGVLPNTWKQHHIDCVLHVQPYAAWAWASWGMVQVSILVSTVPGVRVLFVHAWDNGMGH